jgi:UDP-N-acetylmuramyl pentapeptide phosphotransferase/UDP-N-acetylglucosamine-1-phosphate transferase
MLFVAEGSIAECFKLLIPLLILVPTGMIDDMVGIRAINKLLLQLLTALFCWYCGIRIEIFLGIDLPDALNLLLTIFWIVSYINAFNLIDGLDGLAAGIATISALCLSGILIIHSFNNFYAYMMLCTAAACIGFLRYNSHPAKLFMGDAGSMFLGYMFAVISIMSATRNASFSIITVSILVCGIPLLDIFLALWRRISGKLLYWNKAGVMTADKAHLHHRLLELYNNQTKAVWYIYLLTIALGCCGIIALVCDKLAPGIALVLLIAVFIIIIKRLAINEIWNSIQLIAKHFQLSGKSIFINTLHPCWDFLSILAGASAAVYIIDPPELIAKLYAIVFYVIPIVIIMRFYKIYKIFWFRADVHMFTKLLRVMYIAYSVSLILVFLIWKIDTVLAFKLCYISGLTSTFLIFTERVSLLWLKTAMFKHVYDSNLFSESVSTVIYGGGVNAAWYILSQYRYSLDKTVRIIGIIDDFLPLQNMIIYGYKIIGTINDIDEIYKKKPFKKLVLTIKLTDEKRRKLLIEFCKSHDVHLTELDFKEIEYKK